MHQSSNVKPTLVTLIAVMTLISGLVNLVWGWGGTAAIVLGTLGLGLLCAPITILPGILGLFEISYALKLLGEPHQLIRPSQNIAILEIVCILAGNFLSAMVGILALIFYNDPAVIEHFASLSGTSAISNQPAISAPEST